MGNWKKSGSGGFTGVIVGVGFSKKVWNEGEEKEYSTVSLDLQVAVEGATGEPMKRFLPAGFLNDGQSVSDDGKTLVSESGDPVIGNNTEAAGFVDSLEEQGFDKSLFPADYNDLSAMIGARIKAVDKVDEAATKEFGKRKGKGKNEGKEFNRTRLTVETYFGQVDVKKLKVGSGAKATGAAAPKATGAKAGGAKGTAAKATPATMAPAVAAQGDSDVEGALLSILADAKDNTLPQGQLNSQVIRYATANNFTPEQRETLRKRLTAVEFLNQSDKGWVYDADSKTVTLG